MEKPRIARRRATARRLCFGGLAAVFQISSALALPVITDLEVGGAQITLTFTDDGSSNRFEIERNPGLDPANWSRDRSVNVTDLGGGQFRYTLARTAATSEFFRIIGSFLGTGLDRDGDGLPNVLEDSFTVNTNSTKYSDSDDFDTDNDGFSDGVEYAYGTDPNDPNSHPQFDTDKPIVNFVLGDSKATEGAGPHQVQILFDRPPSSSVTVNYAINAMSNTAAGVDYAPVSGSITTSGTSAVIPITPIDDANVSGQRVIVIDLKLNGENYFIGGRASHVVLLEDNDAWWTGTVVPASGETDSRIFRVKIAHQGGTATAVFGAGAGTDGLPIPVVAAGGGAPAIGSTSISTSMIPVGSWPATGVVDHAAQFHATSPVLSVAAGSICNQPLRRQLQLNAQPALNSPNHPHLLEAFRAVGDYTETLSSSTGTLLATLPGSFVLVRDIPAPLPVLSSLVPSAP